MSKRIIIISLMLVFLAALGCSSNKGKYNKSRNGGSRVNSIGSMAK